MSPKHEPPAREVLQALLRGDVPPPRVIDARVRLAHLRCVPGRWVGEARFDASTKNHHGTVHGGFLATILDVAMGYASLSTLAPDEAQRTLEMSVHFLRAIPPDQVGVEGEVVRRGGRTVYCEGSVRTVDGEIVARGSATFYVRRAVGSVGENASASETTPSG